MAEIPEAAQRARQMYADGVDTRTIMAETGLTLYGLYNWIEGRASSKGEQLLPPLTKRKIVRNLRITPGDRRSLVERMMRSAERQVAEIELRVGAPRHDREKDARMLAVLARAMRELTAVDALNRDLERVKEPAPNTEKSGHRQFSHNYAFFGAPVGLFFAREKAHGPAQWADIGGYLQTVCLLARDHGLHTCPQQAWVSFHKTVRSFLNLPENLMIYSGMAVGFGDEEAPINRWRSPREPLDGFATFSGFTN